MHIPENYLSPSTCAVFAAAMLPVWTIAAHEVKKKLPAEKLPLLGAGAAFAFLAMMFNVPLPGGTTGHAVGGTLLALLLGPWTAVLMVSMALLIQAVFFGDGGILALGANCFNMAFVLPFVGYGTARALKKLMPRHQLAAAGIGAYAGINAAALCAAVEFGVQPLLFTDGAGQALYCPYPLWVSVPAMMIGHLTIFGLAEVVFTTGVLAYLRKAAPDLLPSSAAAAEKETVPAGGARRSTVGRAVKALLVALVLLTPLGLLAEGTAWGEWDAEELASLPGVGYVPQGMEDGFSYEALFPDYSVSGMPDALGYILSAVIGVALLVIVFKVLTSFGRHKVNYDAV